MLKTIRAQKTLIAGDKLSDVQGAGVTTSVHAAQGTGRTALSSHGPPVLDGQQYFDAPMPSSTSPTVYDDGVPTENFRLVDLQEQRQIVCKVASG